MENCSFYNALANDVYALTTDQLIDLQDLISGTIEARKKEKMIDLQKKAINAIKDYLKEGGDIGYDDYTFFEVDERPEYADDYRCIHFR